MTPPLARPILAANWKMNHGPSQARAFVAAFLARFSPRADRTIVLFPPALSLATVRDALADRRDVRLGVQNIHHEDKGAFTGEASAPMAADAGASFALVGHSERRHVFGETDAATARKCAAALRAGLVPMLCVGETIEEREAGRTEEVVLRQLQAGVAMLEPDQVRTLVVAYEPVWAIGTGRTATPDDAAAVHDVLHRALSGLCEGQSRAVPVLYGGSVNGSNAASLLAAPGVDGLLVGGASLDPESWTAIAGAPAPDRA
jgi:triosephosphate isomerase (TIM)